MTEPFPKNTVQHTLCIPLWGRMIATRRYPLLFPDPDAGRIVRELGVDLSHSPLYLWQLSWVSCAVRQYDLAWEINRYLQSHPNAAVVEMGAGLSALRRQMKNETNPWYSLDLPEVIRLREAHLPAGRNERNVACDLNDVSWFDRIAFDPRDGIVFVAGGLFYYFEKAQVHHLLCAMAEHFPGGILAFDATNARGLHGVNREVRLTGNARKSFFSLEDPKRELEKWSPHIVNVEETDYMRGYLPDTRAFSPMTKLGMRVLTKAHLSFVVRAEFSPEPGP